jgi:hypothetical protein
MTQRDSWSEYGEGVQSIKHISIRGTPIPIGRYASREDWDIFKPRNPSKAGRDNGGRYRSVEPNCAKASNPPQTRTSDPSRPDDAYYDRQEIVCASRMEAIGVNRQAGDVRRTTRWSSIQLEGACRALAVQVSLVVVPSLLHIPVAHLQVQSRVVKWVCVGEVMAPLTLVRPRRRHLGWSANSTHEATLLYTH